MQLHKILHFFLLNFILLFLEGPRRRQYCFLFFFFFYGQLFSLFTKWNAHTTDVASRVGKKSLQVRFVLFISVTLALITIFWSHGQVEKYVKCIY